MCVCAKVHYTSKQSSLLHSTRAREEAAQFVFQSEANEVFKKAINISQKGRAGLGAAHLKVPSTLLGVCQKFHVVVFSPFHTLSAAVRPGRESVFYIFYPPAGAETSSLRQRQLPLVHKFHNADVCDLRGHIPGVCAREHD